MLDLRSKILFGRRNAIEASLQEVFADAANPGVTPRVSDCKSKSTKNLKPLEYGDSREPNATKLQKLY